MAPLFAANLEITRLAQTETVTHTISEMCAIAAQLSGSGSDLHTEEELAQTLGRGRIADECDSSFRCQILGPPGRVSWKTLGAGFKLALGPGPTVLRAIKERNSRPSLLSMVIQCSFLAATHDAQQLSYVLSQALQADIFETTAHYQNVSQPKVENLRDRIPPNSHAIKGTLQAIEDQTADIDWRGLLVDVGYKLGFLSSDIYAVIPSKVLQGLAMMLPIVQRFPEIRRLVVEISGGPCAIVVWAHHILGLSVMVRFIIAGRCDTETLFGTASPHVTINMHVDGGDEEPLMRPFHCDFEHSVTLLSSGDDQRIVFKADLDDVSIGTAARGPLLGYANRLLQDKFPRHSLVRDFIHEMSLIATALALVWSSHLHIAELPPWPHDGSQAPAAFFTAGDNPVLPLFVDPRRVIKAARLIFDDDRINEINTDPYVADFSGKSMNEFVVKHGGVLNLTIQRFSENPSDPKAIDSWWGEFRTVLLNISVLIVTLARVTDLTCCAQFPLRENDNSLLYNPLSQALRVWDGVSNIFVDVHTAYALMVAILTNDMSIVDGDTQILHSNWGWSVFLSSFQEQVPDPSDIDKGTFAIQRGVPCRGNVWKHAICQTSTDFEARNPWVVEQHDDTEMNLQPRRRLKFGRTWYYDCDDVFMLEMRLHEVDSLGKEMPKTNRKTGYLDFACAVWLTVKTTPCEHVSRPGMPARLPAECMVLSGFGDHSRVPGPDDHSNIRILVCLTAGSTAARWRALIAIQKSRFEAYKLARVQSLDLESFMPTLLRDSNCCLQCAINQAVARTGPWFVVL